MISLQSKKQVSKEFAKLGISVITVGLGRVEVLEDLSLKQRELLKNNLLVCGMKLHEEKKGLLIEKIKESILEMIQYSDGHPVMSHSIYLSVKLNYNYTYLANIFSEVTGITIQQYIILGKIERVKKLLIDNDINLSEISYKQHYSSVAHLSGQLKKSQVFPHPAIRGVKGENLRQLFKSTIGI